MTWYKSAQAESLECEMSNEELLEYSRVVSNLKQKNTDIFTDDTLRSYPSLVELMRSGYAPLAFSRCMRKGAAPWGIYGSWLPFWTLEKLLRDDGYTDLLYSRHSIIDETRTNLAHWFMETFMPLAAINPNLSKDSFHTLISNKYITSEMISRFWELDRKEREKSIRSSDEIDLASKAEFYASLFRNQNTPSNIQLEIAKITGYRNDSFRWLIRNPNGSGDALAWMLDNDRENSFSKVGRNYVKNIFDSMPVDAKISDSIANAISSRMLKIVKDKNYNVYGNGLPDSGFKNSKDMSFEEKSTIMEYLNKICMSTQSKAAMQNLFSLVLAMGGIEKKEHSLEPMKGRHFFSNYTRSSATMNIVRMLSVFVVNHEKMDQELLQKILVYLSSIDNLYLDDVMEDNGMRMTGFDTVGVVWSAFSGSGIPERHSYGSGAEWERFVADSKNNIINAVKKLDMKKFLAHAESTGMPKLKMYKIAISQVKIKMGGMDSWAKRM